MNMEAGSLTERLQEDAARLVEDIRLKGESAPGVWNELVRVAADRGVAGWSWERQLMVTRAAMEHLVDLSQEARSRKDDQADKLLDQANVWSFNLAADLAPCWPGDEEPREIHHLEAGLAAALQCLEWRQQLGKGDFPFALAWWARGVHELFLGRPRAVESFHQATQHGLALAAAQGRGTMLDGDAVYMHLVNAGYGAIALAHFGDGQGVEDLRQVLEAFQEQATRHPEEAEDAAFGRDQLHWTARRLGVMP